MKKIKFASAAMLLVFAALIQWGCQFDPADNDIAKVKETLVLTPSSTAIALDENNLQNDIITFNWTPARKMSDDYVVSYTTKLDLLGNNFGSATVIHTAEEDGVFSHSFTSEQLNNWAHEKWNLPVNKPFILEFRVVAQWEGGPTFEAPEVRTVTVTVQPIKVEVFAADKMSLAGSALNETTEIEKTLENESQYAWLGNLTIGDMNIPVELDGLTYYICPKDGNTVLKDGEPMDVKMQETPVSWRVTKAGQYRVVVNMTTKQVTVYSPDKALTPCSVTFYPNGTETLPTATIEVSELWAYGGGTGWGAKKLGCKQSLADPQILVYSGAALGGLMKFCVTNSFTVADVSYNQNNAYAFTAPLTNGAATNGYAMEQGKWTSVEGGSDKPHRNSYLTLPSGTNFIIFDLRNMRIMPMKK